MRAREGGERIVSQVLWHLVLMTMIMFHKRLKTSQSGHFDTGVMGDKNTVCLKNGLPICPVLVCGGGKSNLIQGEKKKNYC